MRFVYAKPLVRKSRGHLGVQKYSFYVCFRCFFFGVKSIVFYGVFVCVKSIVFYGVFVQPRHNLCVFTCPGALGL